MNLDASDRPFVILMLDKVRYYNDKPNAVGTRRPIMNSRSGVRDATRSLCGCAVPHPLQRRWRLRIRSNAAEEILREVLPDLNPRRRARAKAAISRVNGDGE